MTDAQRPDRRPEPPTSRRDRRQPAASGRHPQGHRRVRVLLRPLDGRHAVGRRRCAARIRAPGSAASTSARRWPPPACTAVLTHEDVPGDKTYGLEIADQPVLAIDQVRYQGEPVAIVAADHPETARRAAAKIVVDYEVLEPITDARAAMSPDSPLVHATPTQDHYPGGGNVLRHVRIRRGDPRRAADVVVTGEYEVGMQDQAFLGPESGLAVPAEDGGVDLFIATQWLHVDQRQVAASLGLPEDKVRLTLAGVGGAFGAREDLSMQIHACLLALRTGRPVKMVYSREESFFGHVHRHPAHDALRARREPRRHARLRQGRDRARRRRLRVELARGGRATRRASRSGPYECDNVVDRRLRALHQQPAVRRDARLRRGAGCFAPRVADGQARRRARAWIRSSCASATRCRGLAAADRPGRSTAPRRWPSCCAACSARRCRSTTARRADLRTMPGGVVEHDARRRACGAAIGYAVGFKNVGFSEGFDDYSTARVRLEVIGGEPVATVHTAAAEVGQGLVTVMAQIARTELGVEQVVNHPADTSVGSAGSTSASRQTYCTGGAVRGRLRRGARAGRRRWPRRADCRPARRWSTVAAATDDRRADRASSDHRPTVPLTPRPTAGPATSGRATRTCSSRSPRTGSSPTSTSSSGWSGWSRWPPRRTSARRCNPLSVVGQIQGGTTQGIGLALMEEIQVARRQDPQPVVHRLPDPDDPRHAADAVDVLGTGRPGRAVRAARRRRAADDLVDARRSCRRCAPRPGGRSSGYRFGPSTSPVRDGGATRWQPVRQGRGARRPRGARGGPRRRRRHPRPQRLDEPVRRSRRDASERRQRQGPHHRRAEEHRQRVRETSRQRRVGGARARARAALRVVAGTDHAGARRGARVRLDADRRAPAFLPPQRRSDPDDDRRPRPRGRACLPFNGISTMRCWSITCDTD